MSTLCVIYGPIKLRHAFANQKMTLSASFERLLVVDCSEKPMTVDEKKCQQILDAIEETGKSLRVTFN